jgi:hypothetical protein
VRKLARLAHALLAAGGLLDGFLHRFLALGHIGCPFGVLLSRHAISERKVG